MPTAPNATAPNASNVLLGRGKLYGDRLSLVNGVYNKTGEFDLGNCTAFEITPKADVKEKYESMDPFSSLYARAVTRQTHSIKITGDEYSLFNLANALMGNTGQLVATGASVSAEALTSAPLAGAWYALKHRNVQATLSPPVMGSSATATTGGTLTPGTYFYKVTATNAAGETIGGTEVSQVVPTGTSTNTVTINWTAVAGASGYKVYRGTSAGGEAVFFTVATGSTVTYTDTGTAGTAGSPPTTNTASSIVLHDGAATKVLGTDFAVDPVSGRIQILAGGSILPTDTLTVDYTYSSYTYNFVEGGNQASVDMYVRFKGAPVKGPTYEAEFWHVQFTPSGNLGFIADDFGNWTIEGMCLVDTNLSPDGSLYRLLQTA